jgi:hypothetical protein
VALALICAARERADIVSAMQPMNAHRSFAQAPRAGSLLLALLLP